MYLVDWHLSLFVKCLPLEAVVRIWDIYLSVVNYDHESEICILKIGLALLKIYASR
jgi:hypothetical protein